MDALSDKEREYVAIGAAIGAGCRPCTQYHVNAALKAGLSRDEVRTAAEEAEALRVTAAVSVADYARGLLGDGEKRGHDFTDIYERSQALVRIGAATGGNAGPFLSEILPQARGLGLTNDVLGEAVEVAGMVKRMAGNFFEKDAQRALGRAEEVATVAEAAGCAGAAPADAEAVQSVPGRCC
jgi:AhpD family alkylhydroperoxidase